MGVAGHLLQGSTCSCRPMKSEQGKVYLCICELALQSQSSSIMVYTHSTCVSVIVSVSALVRRYSQVFTGIHKKWACCVFRCWQRTLRIKMPRMRAKVLQRQSAKSANLPHSLRKGRMSVGYRSCWAIFPSTSDRKRPLSLSRPA